MKQKTLSNPAIRPYKTKQPHIASTAYIDPQSSIIGDTTIGNNSSVWPMAVIRGDVNKIRIGHTTNIQDGSILHVAHENNDVDPHNSGYPLLIGNEVTIGHNATIHACTIGNRCLIGMGSILLDGCIIEDECIIGAGSLVPPRKIITSGYLWLGNPAKKIRKLTSQEIDYLVYSAQHYHHLAQDYLNPLK